MAEWRKAGGRVSTWPQSGPALGSRGASAWADDTRYWTDQATHIIRQWFAAECAPGRLLPWLPVCFGIGIIIYFAALTEPAWWAGSIVLAVGAAAAIQLRARAWGFVGALAFTAIAAGFTAGTVRTLYVAHPVLGHIAWNVEIAGFVEIREERERSDRIVLRVHHLNGGRLWQKPDRVRLSVRKGTAPSVGQFVTLKARLSPPLQALRPGSYDFARDMYFQNIGASGFVLGAVKVVEASAPPDWRVRYVSEISAMRGSIDHRIRAAISGDNAAIASALFTGTRDAISSPVNDAMYVSGLGHVLSISGYHMAIVAGVIFFFVRGILALIPAIANRHPIKKWAAIAALFVAAFYLLLSGAEVATQRSFIMTAIVLTGVIFDRSAVTLRTISIAALGVLLLQPESVVHPSFQMSFAATLALVSGYQQALPWFSRGTQTSWGAKIALWGGREVVGLIVVSLLAGFATMLFTAYHFHRLAPYGVIANLFAMPIVSAWVMPMGMLAILAIPFGFDGPLWQAMALGIDWMVIVSVWVAHLPGAVGRVMAFGTGPLLLGSLGLIVICLLRTPLRFTGAAFLFLATLWGLHTPLPDVLVASEGQAVAIRNAQGHLTVMKRGNDDFAIREWLGADADARLPRDPSLSDAVACDDIGCVGHLADNTLVALSFSPEAMEEDCRRAAIVISPLSVRKDCARVTIARPLLREAGAMALYRNGSTFEIARARARGQDRPWARAVASEREHEKSVPVDATPHPEDIGVE